MSILFQPSKGRPHSSQSPQSPFVMTTSTSSSDPFRSLTKHEKYYITGADLCLLVGLQRNSQLLPFLMFFLSSSISGRKRALQSAPVFFREGVGLLCSQAGYTSVSWAASPRHARFQCHPSGERQYGKLFQVIVGFLQSVSSIPSFSLL